MESREGLVAALEESVVLLQARERLDNAIQKLGPFAREASVPFDVGGGEAGQVRYTFRPAVCGESARASSEAPLIVFFHGMGCSKYDFVGAIDRLQNAHVLAFDWPGTGVLEASQLEEDEAFLDAMANANRQYGLDFLADFAHAALVQIFKDVGLEPGARFILVGHSMGAKVATLYAAKFPEDLSALVNVEGHLHPSDPRMARKLVQELDQEVLKRCRSCNLGFVETHTASNNEFRIMQDEFDRVQKHFLESSPDSDSVAKWMQVMRQMTSVRGFFAQARAIATEGYETPDRLWRLFVDLVASPPDALSKCDATTSPASALSESALSDMKLLHIYGQRNRELLSSSLDIYRNRCQGQIDIREVSNSGHFPFFDNPDEFWSLLEGWLAENGFLPEA